MAQLGGVEAGLVQGNGDLVPLATVAHEGGAAFR